METIEKVKKGEYINKFGGWTATQWMKISVDKHKALDAGEEKKNHAYVIWWSFSVKHTSDTGIIPDRLAKMCSVFS